MEFYPIHTSDLSLCTIKIKSGDKEATFMELGSRIPARIRYKREEVLEIPDEDICKGLNIPDVSPLLQDNLQNGNHPDHDLFISFLEFLDKYLRS